MLQGHYELPMVALSILVAICGAYTGFELADRVTAATRRSKPFWIAGGASALGTAVWSMHYIGMLAFRLPVRVRYDIPLVVVSFLAAVIAAAVALIVISRKRLSSTQLSAGAIAMGAGIGAMHYIGMAAMQMACICTYDVRLVAVSVCVAVIVSGVALRILRSRTGLAGARKIGAAVLLGVAISSLHYIGMAAARFWPSAATVETSTTVGISWLAGISIGAGALLLLSLAFATALIDKYVSAQSGRIRSTEARYRGLFDRSLAAMYISELDGTIIDVNQAFIELLGYKSRAEVLGRKIRSTHLPEHVLKTYSELLMTTKAFPARQTRLFRTDGSVVWVMLGARVLEFEDGSPPENHGMMWSIDALKRTEDELRVAKYAAESASLTKSQFLANMSHELRTPLNGVLGMTELLRETAITSEQKEYVEITRKSAESLLTLINHILEFSISQAAETVSNEEFDLRKLVREEASWAAPIAAEKGLRLRCEVSPHIAEKFWGEPRWIRQILSALVSNALRFTLSGEIVVAITTEGQSASGQVICISVRDTGVGIPPQKQATIFEPFSQADNSNSRPFGGMGLGLSIVHNLVEAMGGKISVSSEAKKGSVFLVQVPLMTQSNPEGILAEGAALWSDARGAMPCVPVLQK